MIQKNFKNPSNQNMSMCEKAELKFINWQMFGRFPSKNKHYKLWLISQVLIDYSLPDRDQPQEIIDKISHFNKIENQGSKNNPHLGKSESWDVSIAKHTSSSSSLALGALKIWKSDIFWGSYFMKIILKIYFIIFSSWFF